MWVLKTELRPSGLAASEPLYPRSHLMTRVGFSLVFGCFQFNCVMSTCSSFFFILPQALLCFFHLYQVWGFSVLYFWVFYCCSLIPFSLLHSEDWRCPGVAGALLSLCSAVVSPFTFSSFECHGYPLHVCWLYVIVRHVCICRWVCSFCFWRLFR